MGEAVPGIDEDAGQAVAGNARRPEKGAVSGARPHLRNDRYPGVERLQAGFDGGHDLGIEGRGIAGHRLTNNAPFKLRVIRHLLQYLQGGLHPVAGKNATVNGRRGGLGQGIFRVASGEHGGYAGCTQCSHVLGLLT